MAESVEEDRVATTGERRDCREIRHVPCRKEQSTLASRERGQLLLKPLVLDTVTRYQMGSSAAATMAQGRFTHGGRRRWMAREPEIVVATEIDEAPAFHDH